MRRAILFHDRKSYIEGPTEQGVKRIHAYGRDNLVRMGVYASDIVRIVSWLVDAIARACRDNHSRVVSVSPQHDPSNLYLTTHNNKICT